MELCVNKTTSVPKSILHYVLEKGHYFGPEISLYPLLYLNKKTVTHRVLVILQYKFKLCAQVAHNFSKPSSGLPVKFMLSHDDS